MTETPGFYQNVFTPTERRDLEAAPRDPTAILNEEINMVRVAVRRMFRISKHQSQDDAVKTLAILSAVSGRLANLVRAQQQIKSGAQGVNEFKQLLEDVLVEVQADWIDLP
jgi:hypothetical protein